VTTICYKTDKILVIWQPAKRFLRIFSLRMSQTDKSNFAIRSGDLHLLCTGLGFCHGEKYFCQDGGKNR